MCKITLHYNHVGYKIYIFVQNNYINKYTRLKILLAVQS